MVLAIENTRSFSGFGSVRIVDELPGLFHAGNLEQEENVIGIFNGAPHLDESKACVPMGGCVRSKNRLPSCEVGDAITTEHVGHVGLSRVLVCAFHQGGHGDHGKKQEENSVASVLSVVNNLSTAISGDVPL